MKNVTRPTRLMPVLASMAFVAVAALFGWSVLDPRARSAAPGPLRVLASNPRYLTDGTGRAVFLTGSNQGSELQDNAWGGTMAYTWYLNFLEQHNHNFIRLWVVGFTRGANDTYPPASPMPFARSGPCCANDGQPKFNLRQRDHAFFDRLRARIIQARDRGIYVSIMLFDKWSANTEYGDRWSGNPFHPNNNINGINGDPNGDGQGLETLTLQDAAMTAIQEAYVATVIDTVKDLANVLYEIANEPPHDTKSWQEHMTAFIKNREAGKPKQHPVWMSSYGNADGNDTLFAAPADAIGPGGTAYGDPPPVDGRRVIILDSDHIQPFSTDSGLPWRVFLRGNGGFVHMDEMHGAPADGGPEGPIRWAMGDARRYADKMHLAAMTPRGDLSSTGYVLANPGSEYLIYNPGGGAFSVNLQSATYHVEWFHPSSRQTRSGGQVSGGGSRTFDPPFGGDAVLYLKGPGAGVPPTPRPTASRSASPTPPPAVPPSPFAVALLDGGELWGAGLRSNSWYPAQTQGMAPIRACSSARLAVAYTCTWTGAPWRRVPRLGVSAE